MKKDYFISVLIYHFMTFDLRQKLSFKQYFEFEDLLRRRWNNKFKKIFLSGAVYDLKKGFEGYTELTTLKEDFKGCFDCYCKEFVK